MIQSPFLEFVKILASNFWTNGGLHLSQKLNVGAGNDIIPELFQFQLNNFEYQF